jgi:S-formylglutathione hydrolase
MTQSHRRSARALPGTILCIVACALFLSGTQARAQDGQLVEEILHSRALEGNLIGDPADRRVTIYLPAGYDEGSERYPVLYLYHGFTATDRVWQGREYMQVDIRRIADEVIAAGEAQPMIIVMPDADNRLNGHGHSNGPTLGNWVDYLTEELVAHVDATYRTLPSRNSRGVAGHSGGGFKTIKFAMMKPETFGAAYSMSACCVDFEKQWLQDQRTDTIGAPDVADMSAFDGLNWLTQTVFAAAAAVAPNPDNPPFYADFPFDEVDGEPQLREDVWLRWLAHDPITMLADHVVDLKQLNALAFDVGTGDFLLGANRTLDAALSTAGVPHVYEEYAGDHLNRIGQRLQEKVLPFFSQHLSAEDPASAVAGNSWGRVKISGGQQPDIAERQ